MVSVPEGGRCGTVGGVVAVGPLDHLRSDMVPEMKRSVYVAEGIVEPLLGSQLSVVKTKDTSSRYQGPVPIVTAPVAVLFYRLICFRNMSAVVCFSSSDPGMSMQ